MSAYLAEIRWPDVPEPVYLAEINKSEIGYSFNRDSAARFATPEAAVRVAVSWSPSLEPYVTAVAVES